MGLSTREAASRFNRARSAEPHPLFAAGEEVVTFLAEVQAADRVLAEALDGDVSSEERGVLLRRRQSADAAVSRRMQLLARRMSQDREGAITTFNEVFRSGAAPGPPLDGRYQGQLISTTVTDPLDTLARFVAKVYLVWLGKRFMVREGRGDNVFRPGMRAWGRLVWPTYGGYKPYGGVLLTGFPFRTSTGQGVQDPETTVLRLDYDVPGNPSFIVRDVLDELVQITGDYYLGKAYIRRDGGEPRLVAYFALQRAPYSQR
jgi:hypothetical protein